MLSDSFISGLQALSEHWNYLSFFGDAAQFERRNFDFPSPHKREFFVGRDCYSAGREIFSELFAMRI
jgi:hypothetical protein